MVGAPKLGSRAVAVAAALLAAVLPLSFGCATAPAAAPSSAPNVTISLSRSICYGFCPSYRVTIHGDGTVRYIGQCFVAVRGIHDYQVPAADVAKLVEEFEAANFFSLRDSYRAHITDNPTYTLTLTIGVRTKTVSDYVGKMDGMPEIVTTLENAVDRVGATAQFVGKPEPGRGGFEDCDKPFDTPPVD